VGSEGTVQSKLTVWRWRDVGRKRIDASTWRQVEKFIREDWSPEQISKRLKKDHNLRISHEWIYQYILADKRAGGDVEITNLYA
jgi:IS30 family transposase